MSILVVGSVALDSIQTSRGNRKDILGGSATFFSLSASRFAPVNLVAVTGNDFPPRYKKVLKRKNINLLGLKEVPGKTFRWKASYACDINNPETLDTQLNVFGTFNPEIPKKFLDSKIVFLANIDPDLQSKVLGQIKSNKLIACDSMNYWILNKRRSLLSLLKKVDIYLANDGEAKLLSGTDNLLKAAKKILSLGPKIVIIKKGEHGVLYFSKNTVFAAPAYLLETIIDPTGAGDTFAGGFIGYLAASKKINESIVRKAVMYGSCMASFAVESFSVDRLVSLRKSEIQRRYKEFERLTRF